MPKGALPSVLVLFWFYSKSTKLNRTLRRTIHHPRWTPPLIISDLRLSVYAKYTVLPIALNIVCQYVRAYQASPPHKQLAEQGTGCPPGRLSTFQRHPLQSTQEQKRPVGTKDHQGATRIPQRRMGIRQASPRDRCKIHPAILFSNHRYPWA